MVRFNPLPKVSPPPTGCQIMFSVLKAGSLMLPQEPWAFCQPGPEYPCWELCITGTYCLCTALFKGAGPETALLMPQEEDRVSEQAYMDDYDEPLPKWSTHQARTVM